MCSFRLGVWLPLFLLISFTLPGLASSQTHYEPSSPQSSSNPPQCRDVPKISTHRQCNYVANYCTEEDDGILSYFSLYYCQLATAQPLALLVLILWLAFLFSTLAITAGDFLAINLGSIAQDLKMSDTLAGVTFLALGNGAPDVFSTIAAMKDSSDNLAIGELLGAAAFITGVIPGSMALIRSFGVVKEEVIRDAAFLFLTIAFLTFVLADGYLRMWHCLVLLATYIIYIAVVMSWHWWRSHRSTGHDAPTRPATLGIARRRSDATLETDPLIRRRRSSQLSHASLRSSEASDEGQHKYGSISGAQSYFHDALDELVPAHLEEGKYRWFHVARQTIMMPAMIALKLTNPRIEEEEVDEDMAHSHSTHEESIEDTPNVSLPWDRWLTVIQCFTAPQFIAWQIARQLSKTASQMLIPCLICLGFSVVATTLILVTTSSACRPRWYRLLCIPGFAVSIAWISTLADEIVAVLRILGIISNIPDAIMGITVFAIGNSLDDWAADISVAQHKHPVMALSACFGGPLFNILLGLSISGISVMLADAKNKNGPVAISLKPSRSLYIVSGTAMANIALLLVLMIWTRWRMTKLVGYILTGVWTASTVVNVALELTG